MYGFAAKSGSTAFQSSAIGSVGTQPKRDPVPLLDHVFSFLGKMRDENVIPAPAYGLMPTWVRRLTHTPYASIKDLDLRFLKAAIHCDSYLRVIKSGYLNYEAFHARPRKQVCINLLYQAVSLINGEDPVWYSHRVPEKDEHNEYVLELNANLEFNRILFGEEGHHIGPLHSELPDEFDDDIKLSLDDRRFMTTAEANEQRKKLRYGLKSFKGVIPDVSHPRYHSLKKANDNQKIFNSLIKPLFERLMKERVEFLQSGYPVGKPPDGFDEVIRKGVPHAFAGKFYAVELLHRYRRYKASMNDERLPEFVAPLAAAAVGPGGFVLSHLWTETKSPPSVFVDTLRRNAVSAQMCVDLLTALGAKERTLANLMPGISPSNQVGPLSVLLQTAKSTPGGTWADYEVAVLDALLPLDIPDVQASKNLAWNELQLAKARAVELSSEAELLKGLKGSRILKLLR